MNQLKKVLGEIIVSKPDILQFAKDRKFEESWIIPLSKPRPSGKDISAYLQKDTFQTIIVEYVWNSSDDDNRFVLTLFLDQQCKLKDSKEFVDISLDLFYDYEDFESFIQIIDDKIIGKEYLLNNLADSVNLSVFNHWLSVGPIELWNKKSVYEFEEIKSKIHSRPEIETTSLNYQGLFFRFNVDGKSNGPYYGIKTPCCNKVGEKWTIDYKKIDYWTILMLEL